MIELEAITCSAADPESTAQVSSWLDTYGCALVTDIYCADAFDEIVALTHALEAQVHSARPELYAEGSVWSIKSVFETSPELAIRCMNPLLSRILLNAMHTNALVLFAGTLMAKTGAEDTPINWHQDNGIPVDRDLKDERSKGTREGGVPYRMATKDVLDRCVQCRIHIEPHREKGGCLRVAPGSHAWDTMGYDAVAERVADIQQLDVPAPAGSALLSRMTLAHMSPPAENILPDGEQRRVIQAQFHTSDVNPGFGLDWYKWETGIRIGPEGASVH